MANALIPKNLKPQIGDYISGLEVIDIRTIDNITYFMTEEQGVEVTWVIRVDFYIEHGYLAYRRV